MTPPCSLSCRASDIEVLRSTLSARRPAPPLQLIEGIALVASALPDGQRQPCVQQMLDIVVQPMQGILQARRLARVGGIAMAC